MPRKNRLWQWPPSNTHDCQYVIRAIRDENSNMIFTQIIIKHCLPWVTCNYLTSSNENTFNINITFCSSRTRTSQWRIFGWLLWPFLLVQYGGWLSERYCGLWSYHHYYGKSYWALHYPHQIRWGLFHLQWRMLGHVSRQEMKLFSFPNCWNPPCGLTPCIPIPWNLVMLMLFRPIKIHSLHTKNNRHLVIPHNISLLDLGKIDFFMPWIQTWLMVKW